MAFSTPCWKNKHTSKGHWPVLRAAWLCLLALAAALALPARAQSSHRVDITLLRLERADDGIYLSAAVSFDLPSPVLEVLDKGIPLTFVAEAELLRERWYWTDQQLGHAARYMRLSYQPLTRRWRLNISPVPITGAAGVRLSQNYDTLEDALNAVRRIGRLRLADAGDLADGAAPTLVFRFRLDTTQLPRPFQIGLVGQSEWNLAVERTARLPLERLR